MECCTPSFTSYPLCAIQQYKCKILKHQLNINKCITKQYHEMTIEQLSLFVSWVDSFLIFQLHNLIIMIRWIKGSSRVDSFIFLMLKGSSLDGESLIFSCSHLLFFYYESSFFLCALFLESAEGNHFLLAHILQMNESHDPGRPFKVVITISYSSSISSSRH